MIHVDDNPIDAQEEEQGTRPPGGCGRRYTETGREGKEKRVARVRIDAPERRYGISLIIDGW